MEFLAGICVGVILLAAVALGVSAWMFRRLSASDPNEVIVIEGTAYEGDR